MSQHWWSVVKIASTDFRMFKHGFLIAKHSRAYRQWNISPCSSHHPTVSACVWVVQVCWLMRYQSGYYAVFYTKSLISQIQSFCLTITLLCIKSGNRWSEGRLLCCRLLSAMSSVVSLHCYPAVTPVTAVAFLKDWLLFGEFSCGNKYFLVPPTNEWQILGQCCGSVRVRVRNRLFSVLCFCDGVDWVFRRFSTA